MKTGVMMLTEDLPRLFVDLGKSMVGGLIGGIGDMGSALKDSVVGIASNSANWFKEKLGILSPSRVFMGLGEMVGEGAAIGIGRMGNAVARSAAGLGVAAGLAFQPALAADMPIGGQHAGAAGKTTITNHFSITIAQRSGEDAEMLARRVVELIRRGERLDRRAGLGDWGNE